MGIETIPKEMVPVPMERAAMSRMLAGDVKSLTRLDLRPSMRPHYLGPIGACSSTRAGGAAGTSRVSDAGIVTKMSAIDVRARPADRRRRARRPGLGHRRGAAGPRLRGDREGRPRQLDLPLPARDDLLHHARAAGDRRPALRDALREAHRSGRRSATTAAWPTPTACGSPSARRSWVDRRERRRLRASAVARPARRPAEPPRAQRRRRHRLLRPSEPARHPRRGPPARLALLRRAAPLLPPAGRGRGRQELRRDRRARALPRRRHRDPRPPRRAARRLDQVLDQARHREPHQGRTRSPRASRRGSWIEPERGRVEGPEGEEIARAEASSC